MMIHAENMEFQPTNLTGMESPLAIAAFIVGAILIILSILPFIWKKKSDLSRKLDDARPSLVVVGVGLILVTLVSAPIAVRSVNRANAVENVKAVYQIDDMRINQEGLSEGSPVNVTVLVEGHAYNLILSQDKETFEPSLSSYSSYDMERIKLR